MSLLDCTTLCFYLEFCPLVIIFFLGVLYICVCVCVCMSVCIPTGNFLGLLILSPVVRSFWYCQYIFTWVALFLVSFLVSFLLMAFLFFYICCLRCDIFQRALNPLKPDFCLLESPDCQCQWSIMTPPSLVYQSRKIPWAYVTGHCFPNFSEFSRLPFLFSLPK